MHNKKKYEIPFWFNRMKLTLFLFCVRPLLLKLMCPNIRIGEPTTTCTFGFFFAFHNIDICRMCKNATHAYGLFFFRSVHLCLLVSTCLILVFGALLFCYTTFVVVVMMLFLYLVCWLGSGYKTHAQLHTQHSKCGFF